MTTNEAIWRRELRRLTRLAVPIILAHLLWMLISTVDVIMLGRWSKEDFAASALSNIWVHLTQMIGIGLVMGIDPLVTQAHGARDRVALGRALQRGIIVALIASIPIIALRFLTAEFLAETRELADWFSGNAPGPADAAVLAQDAAAETYALAQTVATPAFLIYMALRQYLQGRGIVRPALVVAVFANVVNVIGNRLLIYDFELGILGAGIATGITRIFMCIALAWILFRAQLLRGGWTPWDRESFDFGAIMRVMMFGVPIALHFLFEMGAFGLSTRLAGLLGTESTAAHAIVINLASMTFMVPLGIALASTTRVGNLIGERKYEDAQTSAHVALWAGGLTMATMGLVLLVTRGWLPHLYVSSDEVAVIALAATILPIAAAFQVFDGLQVVGAGILRGVGSTLPAAVFNFLAWWVIALPVGTWLVLRRDGTLVDLWWSMCLGLGLVAALVAAWVRWRGPARLGAKLAVLRSREP